MPSTTPKMARTMAGAAHDPAFAAKMGIAQNVAKHFNKADQKTGILRKKRKKIGTEDVRDGGVQRG
jgi:hypothetical protein